MAFQKERFFTLLPGVDYTLGTTRDATRRVFIGFIAIQAPLDSSLVEACVEFILHGYQRR